MDFTLLASRLLLAVVFLLAGLAKLADRAGTRQTLIDFGVPAPFAGPLGVLLPIVELACSAALVPRATAWWGALGALALLLVFVAGIAYNLVRGRTPDCRCFGQLHSAPVGWSTLARNAVLATVAGLVVWAGPANPGPSAIAWLSFLTTAQLVGLIAGAIVLGLLTAEGGLLLQLLRQNGRLLLRIETLEEQFASGASAALQPDTGLPVGSPAPDFRLADLDGETVTLDALRTVGKPVLLIFSDPSCGPCTALLPDVARWQRDHTATLTIALISRGSPEANRAGSDEHGIAHVLLQENQEVAQSYQAQGTPAAVLVRLDGTIGSRLALGALAINDLVVRSAGAPTQPPASTSMPPAADGNNGNSAAAAPAAKLGVPVPALKLPDLTGNMVDLADFRGSPTLVLFWNPGCGFCQRMLEDLKAWEASPPQGAPKLLIVSTGTVEANQSQGLRSLVVLDHGVNAGDMLGAHGTPMAVLIDAQGKIASEVAAGGPAVLALASRESRLPIIDYAITTVARPKNYIYELLARLQTDSTIRLIVGGPDCEYLERYRSDPFIEIIEISPHEWAHFQNCNVHHRAIWNYWRSLSLGPKTPQRDGLVVFEDDVIPAGGWQRQLYDTIEQIEAQFGRQYVLALYRASVRTKHWRTNRIYPLFDRYWLHSKEEGTYYALYPIREFFGTQAMYYPEQVRMGIAEYLKYDIVDPPRLPYDLLLKEYLHKQGIPLFATIPCLVQHIGTISTGLGTFHQAREFQECLEPVHRKNAQ